MHSFVGRGLKLLLLLHLQALPLPVVPLSLALLHSDWERWLASAWLGVQSESEGQTAIDDRQSRPDACSSFADAEGDKRTRRRSLRPQPA